MTKFRMHSAQLLGGSLLAWALMAAPGGLRVQSARATDVSASLPVFAKDGTVHVPAFDLPPSTLMSPEAAQALKMRAGETLTPVTFNNDIKDARAGMDRILAPALKQVKDQYAVQITSETIEGVRADVIMPSAGEANPDRVLINLHGGGFMICAGTCGLIESIPIAAVGKIKVISVDYREGPENVFPAASVDVEKVYKSLLAHYQPGNIGIYGCSAGGALTAQATAWLEKDNLPPPAAIGIFGSSGGQTGPGDSNYISGYIDGNFPPPTAKSSSPPGPAGNRSYFEGAKLDDPMVTPVLHLDVLAKFPPTLVITGTRAPDLSGAAYTHNQLEKAGVEGDLIVGEGLGHCYIMSSSLPEARDTYALIVRFFNTHLGKPAR